MNFIFDNNFLTFGFLKVKQWLECTNWKILILKINSAVEDFFVKVKKTKQKKISIPCSILSKNKPTYKMKAKKTFFLQLET